MRAVILLSLSESWLKLSTRRLSLVNLCCAITVLSVSLDTKFSSTEGFAKEIEEPAPFNFNPLLDASPTPPKAERIVEWTEGASGFRVGSFVGLTFGSAASYLSPRISSLDLGTFPLFGLSLGARLGMGEVEGILRRFELSFSSALGFGRTFERGDYDNALDIHLRPTIGIHLLESLNWGFSTSVGLNVIIFDSEDGEVSQVTSGSYLSPRLTWKMSDIAHVYLEFSWSYLYDFLAYSFREPTEEELIDNPAILEIKEKGAWFNHYQVCGGLQLLGF